MHDPLTAEEMEELWSDCEPVAFNRMQQDRANYSRHNPRYRFQTMDVEDEEPDKDVV